MSLLGVIITAVSIGAIKFSEFGVDPFQSFMSGVDALIPIDFGTLYVIVNAVLLLFALFFDRHYIGIATFINLFFLGYVVDLSQNYLVAILPTPSINVRIIIFFLGFISLCFGSALYMSADMGVSTYDAVALICSRQWNIGTFRTVRVATDFLCILIGIVLFQLSSQSAQVIPTFVGVGTVVTAFCMGPIIDYFNKRVVLPFLFYNSLDDD